MDEHALLLRPVCECSGVETDEAVAMAMHLAKHSRWSFETWALTIRGFVSRSSELPDIEDDFKFEMATKYGLLYTTKADPKLINADWGMLFA